MTLVLNEDQIRREIEKDSQQSVESCEVVQLDGDIEGSPEDIQQFIEPVTQPRTSVRSKVSGSSKQNQVLGRPKDPIYEEFVEVSLGRCKCLDCHKVVTGRSDVLKNHKRICKGSRKRSTSQSGESTFVAASIGSANDVSAQLILNHHSKDINTPTRTEKQMTIPKRLKFDGWNEAPISNNPLRKFMDAVSGKEKHALDTQCGRYIYACNLPFRTVENPEFIDFIHKLRPAYSLPNRKEIGNKILNDVYDEVTECLTMAIANKEVVLMQDGWSTNHNEPVIAHSIHCGSQIHFLNAISTGTSSKTAEFCSKLLMEAIEECEQTHKSKVIGVVTDNCSSMINLRKLIRGRRPDIIAYGCSSHYLNLIGRKLTPSNKMENIIDIQKYFKNHHFQSASLSQNNGNRPILPGTTRWNSQQMCLKNFIGNHTTYLDILRKNPNDFSKEIAVLIKSNTIYDEALLMLETATPVAIALDKSQSNTFTIAQAVAEWIKLRNNLNLKGEAQTYFWKKMKEALSPPILSAYILDPRFRGNGLTSDEMETAYLWLRAHDPKLVELAVELEARNEDKLPRYLLNDNLLESIDPRSFWCTVEKRCKFSVNVCQFASRLMKLPASASGIERCFSTMSSILSRNRNNLQVDKLAKLCTIYRSLRCLNDDDMDIDKNHSQ